MFNLGGGIMSTTYRRSGVDVYVCLAGVRGFCPFCFTAWGFCDGCPGGGITGADTDPEQDQEATYNRRNDFQQPSLRTEDAASP